jgi:hypothetical protein
MFFIPKPYTNMLHSHERRFLIDIGKQGLLLLRLAAVLCKVVMKTAVEAPSDR